jgi:hypothetical protein
VPLGGFVRWVSVFLSDPNVAIDTNHLERALRVIPMGRKSWLFCWTEVGAEVVGKIQSLLVTCKFHGVDPYPYLVDVLQRIGSASVRRGSVERQERRKRPEHEKSLPPGAIGLVKH